MQISWMKQNKEEEIFKIPERLGLHVETITNADVLDERIRKLRQENCHIFILSKGLAEEGEMVLRKYKKNENVNIIIK